MRSYIMSQIAALTKNRLFGAVLLISGTAIGAAMLALPVSTGRAGLIPSLMVMSGIWLFLVLAAFYLVELTLSMPKNVNLLSMAEKTLGFGGKVVSAGAYLFLLYALNTAYLFGMTSIMQDLFQLPRIFCMLPLLVLFWLLLKRGVSFIDQINRLFMIGFGASFLLLLCQGACYCSKICLFSDRSYVISSFAIVLCAFGYHIVIPSVVGYLEYNVDQIKKAIWIGSLIPLIVYAIWQITSLNMADQASLHAAFNQGLNSAQMLAKASNSRFISGIDQGFAFFAMITSFFGVSMALFDFLKDGFKTHSNSFLFSVSFIPSMYFALQNEHIFLKALEYAGAYGVVILLALLPAIMVWKKRYVLKSRSSYMVPGGKLLLATFMGLSIALILLQRLCI